MSSEDPKQSILFAITSNNYVRNYVEAGVIENLREHYKVQVVCSSEVTKLDVLRSFDIDPVIWDEERSRKNRHIFLNQILMWRARSRSKTFYYRWLRMANWKGVSHDDGPIYRAISATKWLLSLCANWQALRVPLFGNRVVFPISSRILKALLPVPPSLDALLSKIGPNAVIFPSSAHESLTTDITRAAKRAGVPSAALIDNWDNLSSKTVFWTKPDFVGVWGEQTKQQAVMIQGFDSQQVFKIGTPRFEGYFDQENDPGAPIPNPYVLFAGSAMAFDEITTLHRLEKALENLGPEFSDFRIIYRPHPWQQKRKVTNRFVELDFSRTVLDPQIKSHAELSSSPENFQPDLSYYPRLLNNASVVVGPLTTMLFEAALCHREIIALAYNDGIHPVTLKTYFSHFNGLEKIPGFRFCENPDNMQTLLFAALTADSASISNNSNVLDFYLTFSPGTYSDRLLRMLRTVTKKGVLAF